MTKRNIKNTKKTRRNKKTQKLLKTKPEYPPTYIISHDTRPNAKKRLYLNYLRNYLKQYNLTETKNPHTPTTFLYLDELSNYKFDPRYYNTKCWLANVLSDDKSVITNKFQLYKNMKATFPHLVNKYMAPSYTIEEFYNLTADLNKEVFIVRPSEVSSKSGFGGRGIIILDSPSKLETLKELAQTEKNLIISRYITNPLLFHNRKFHLRIYYIISIVKDVFRSYVYPKYKILTAKEPYKNANYSNPDIHDTHFKTTDVDYIAPDSLPLHDKKSFITIVNPKIKELFHLVSEIVKPHCSPYPNAANAFEVLGCDVMITDDYDVVLLEVNNHIGYNYHKESNRQIVSKNLFKLINDGVLKYALA